MIDKFKHVCIHEAAHLVTYFYLGGRLEDIREVQIRPNSGYIRNVCFPIAENYFTRACVALAGPLSDIIISEKPIAVLDNANAKEYIRIGLRQNQTDPVNFPLIYDREYQAAWAFTESIVAEQYGTILQVSADLADNANKQKIISPRKVRKIGERLLFQWKKQNVDFYDDPSEVSSSCISFPFA